MFRHNKVTNTLALAGALLMQAQLLPLIGEPIPLTTSILFIVGMVLLSLRYLRDWFIMTMNTTGIILHLLIQVYA